MLEPPFGAASAVRGEGTEQDVLRHRHAGAGEASGRLGYGIASFEVSAGQSAKATQKRVIVSSRATASG
jgi:hypothetical protein